MTDSHTAVSAVRFEVRASASDHFAWIRTRLALERTIMAWLRTAVALIGFGFASSNTSNVWNKRREPTLPIFHTRRDIWGSR